MSEQVTTERLDELIVLTIGRDTKKLLIELKALRGQQSAQDFDKFRRNMIRLTAEIGE